MLQAMMGPPFTNTSVLASSVKCQVSLAWRSWCIHHGAPPIQFIITHAQVGQGIIYEGKDAGQQLGGQKYRDYSGP